MSPRYKSTSGGGIVSKQAEIDCGPIPVSTVTVTVNDPAIKTSSKLIARVSTDTPTGKDDDELEMDTFDVQAKAQNGSVKLTLKGLEGYIADKFKIDYFIAS